MFALWRYLQLLSARRHILHAGGLLRPLEAAQLFDDVFQPGSDVVQVRRELMGLLGVGVLVAPGPSREQVPAVDRT